MQAQVHLYVPLYLTVDLETGTVVSAMLNDEGVEVGAGINDEPEVYDLEGHLLGAQAKRAIEIAAEADWPAWQIGG